MSASIHDASVVVDESVNSRILESSRDEFRNSQLSAIGQLYDKVVVGAAAFRFAPNSSRNKAPSILLLKRASDEIYFPGVFELPSGKVDPEDATIKHALIREVQEETGLDIMKIVAELKPMIYTTEKTVVDDTGRNVLVPKSAIQLNYIISISDGDVKLSTNEHSESIWASKGDSDTLNITSEMKIVIRDAFDWAANK